nr:hypothetical protein [Tanacetum cinerariifolium]
PGHTGREGAAGAAFDGQRRQGHQVHGQCRSGPAAAVHRNTGTAECGAGAGGCGDEQQRFPTIAGHAIRRLAGVAQRPVRQG